MYDKILRQVSQTLQSVEKFLNKAEQLAAARKFDVNVLMAGTLAPDMKRFSYQVTSACNYVKQAAASWLSGEPLPQHADAEKTFDELRARIRVTVQFAAGIGAERFDNAEQRKVSYS